MMEDDLMNPINIIENQLTRTLPVIDSWTPTGEDLIIKGCKGYAHIPISRLYGFEYDTEFDQFILSTKRGYNSPKKFKPHLERYLNYFLKYYDTDKELLFLYGQVKIMMSGENKKMYSKTAFDYDLSRFFLRNPSIRYKIREMVNDCYALKLRRKNKNPGREYNDVHAKILMEICIMMNIIIPILTHYMHVQNITDSKSFLLCINSEILDLYDIDIYSKFYETSSTTISKNENENPIWGSQDIRAISSTTHAIETIENILLNILPTYEFEGNIIGLNYAAIKKATIFNVTGNAYDFDYVGLSSSNRDEDNNSEFDKFEAGLAKQNESLLIQNQVNCEETMRMLETRYPVSREELDFYMKELKKNRHIRDPFQEMLVHYLFYKYFGDVYGIKNTNLEQYVKLMIIGKRILLEHNRMVVFPYIFAGRVGRIVTRKNLNRKELLKLEASENFKRVMSKYEDEKNRQNALSIIGTIMSSEFYIIDYNDPTINGQRIIIDADKVSEEVLAYIDLI